ncbi:hypothetical protein AB0E10_11805 [Streptomyces sp. NPDC048045]|uniref:hypothetical protein n=1 Tax=Streptomyces sp. NPDC048045 TaxID=3154710 RepID=UPI0034302D15
MSALAVCILGVSGLGVSVLGICMLAVCVLGLSPPGVSVPGVCVSGPSVVSGVSAHVGMRKAFVRNCRISWAAWARADRGSSPE